jgi:hypothetical protein
MRHGIQHRRATHHFSVGIIIVGLALGVLPASSVIIRHDTPDSEYVNLALYPEYAAVGTFVNSWGYTGSATLIAPDWVLTGAHLFTAASSGTFTLNGVNYVSDQLIAHPNWNSGNVFGGYDFGLVHLTTAVEGIAPAMLYTGSDEIGRVGTFVGYGLTGTGSTGYQVGTAGTGRAFQNEIDGNFGNPVILLGSDFDNPLSAADSDFGSATPLALEGAVASGDSGGAMFITVDDATYLAGIISFIAGRDGFANGDYGDVTGFGRVGAVMPWISSHVPEPSHFALLGWGLVLLGWRHRRRR